MLAGKQNHTRIIEKKQQELVEELKTMELVKGDASKTTMLGTTLPSTIVDDLISFLKESLDVFAWTHKDMPGINKSIIEHRLNIYPKKKPI